MPEGAQIAIDAWNMMGGIEWEALPMAVELFGVEDRHVERFIRQLTVIRDRNNKLQS